MNSVFKLRVCHFSYVTLVTAGALIIFFPEEKWRGALIGAGALNGANTVLVQSDTVTDLILFGGHSDLYIMVQRFCLVSLAICNRKISNRSLKQTAGSTSCPWTTILVKAKGQVTKDKFPSTTYFLIQWLDVHQTSIDISLFSFWCPSSFFMVIDLYA